MVNLKLILAVVLMIISAGVIWFNVDFLSENSGDDSNQGLDSEFERWIFEDDGLDQEEVKPKVRTTTPPPQTVTRENDSGEESPLGKDWDNSVWSEMLSNYLKKTKPQQAAPITTSPIVVADPKPDLKLLETQNRNLLKNELQARADGLTLEGIIYGKGFSSALINGYILHEGDCIPNEEVKVVSINKTSVVLGLVKDGVTETRRKHLSAIKSKQPANETLIENEIDLGGMVEDLPIETTEQIESGTDDTLINDSH